MPYCRLLACFTALACGTTPLAAKGERLERVNLKKLLDPATSEAEVAALLERDDEAMRKDPRFGFGPKGRDRHREVVFRWDKELGAYTAPNLAQQPHVRVLRNANPWKELKDIQAAGGHHYPLVLGKPDKPATPVEYHPGPVTPPPPFHFQSLKDCNDQEIARFMRGCRTQDAFQPEEAPLNTLPNGFWEMEPKAAALAFAKANLFPSLAKTVRLKVDDRKQARPPAAGWIVHDSRSDAGDAASRTLTALRFGIDQPFLFQTGTKHNGVDAAIPLADHTGHTMRWIPLSVTEARFLADTLFWLGRVRGPADDFEYYSIGCGGPGNGFGILDWIDEKRAPRRIEGTLWAVRSLAEIWRGKFDDTTCLNFTDFLLTDGLPAHLGKRWDAAPPLTHRNLTKPPPERLQPHEDSDARDQLADIILTALDRHHTDPWPAPALVALAECAGETGLSATLPALENLAASLPAPTRRETEYRELETRFAGRFEAPEDPLERKPWNRFHALTKELRLDVPCQLRHALTDTFVKLRAFEQPERLLELAKGEGPHSQWALQQLQLRYPDAYSDVLIARFHDAGEARRRTIFNTLAAAHPPGAKRLRDGLTLKEQADLAIELATFETTNEPDLAKSRIPGLLGIFKDPSGTRVWSTRGRAIELLSTLPLDKDQKAQFEALLLEELKTPHRADARISVLSWVTSAITRLPDADRHWDALVESVQTATEFDEFEHLLDALAALAVARPDPRMGQLADFLRPHFTHHGGMMNQLFVAALALDLRALAPEIEHLATTGPDVVDDEFGHSWGGGFTGPGNRRDHAARHVTALWQESDPNLRARMWSALLVASPDDFVGDDTIAKCLRDRCRAAFLAATPDIRPQVVANARTAAKECPRLADWLAGLP